MVRNDLMALCEDDLVTLPTGTVQPRSARTEKRRAAGHVTENQNGDVTVQWDDGVVCQLNAGQRLDGSMCSCPSTQCCRHLIRSVLLYQQHVQAPMDQDTAQPQTDQPPPPLETAPGTLAKSTTKNWPATIHPRSRKNFACSSSRVSSHNSIAAPSPRPCFTPLAVRAVSGARSAGLHHCDCREAAPCRHALWAVWAFRQVPPINTTPSSQHCRRQSSKPKRWTKSKTS